MEEVLSQAAELGVLGEEGKFMGALDLVFRSEFDIKRNPLSVSALSFQSFIHHHHYLEMVQKPTLNSKHLMEVLRGIDRAETAVHRVLRCHPSVDLHSV